MEANLKKTLSKFRKNDLPVLHEVWNCYDINNIVYVQNPKLSKKDAIAAIVEETVDSIVKKDIDKLDLIYVQRYSSQKLWSVFEIELINEDAPVHLGENPEKFESKLQKALKSYASHVAVCVDLKDGAYWVRLELGELRTSPITISYLIHYPHTNYVFTTHSNAKLICFIHQALLSVLGGCEYTELPLRGHCVKSLARMTIHKTSQGAFTEIVDNVPEDNPLAMNPRKRKAPEPDSDSENQNIINENHREKKQARGILDKTFGLNKLPTLEKVDYTLETKFHGAGIVPGMAQVDRLFHMKVKFQGTSVLEGLRELGKAGLVELPMKHHLGNVHRLARNSFLLRQKVGNMSQAMQATQASQG